MITARVSALNSTLLTRCSATGPSSNLTSLRWTATTSTAATLPATSHLKFEEPYKPLLDENVKFYASLGNHDDPQIEINYKPYSMGGSRYYTFQKKNVQFFVLDSNYMTPQQLSWLEDKLKSSSAKWKIAYFHHPLFTCATYHGPDIDLRNQLMPLFTKYGVNAVWSGHEHVYEHLKPQRGSTSSSKVNPENCATTTSEPRAISTWLTSTLTAVSCSLKSTATRCTSKPSLVPVRPLTRAS